MATVETTRKATWTGTNGSSIPASRAESGPNRVIPLNIVQEYVRAAVDGATLKQYEDESWFAAIPGFQGVWAHEASHRQALEVLEEVLFDWTILKLLHEDPDLPRVGDLDLSSI
jgi:predicted RNase H-like HicB family nuclease